MTEIFNYDQLTWPEVEALPRNTPLVIPLGKGYPLDNLERMLGNPSWIGLLPQIPFGWRGSGLQVPVNVLRHYVSNLLGSLREDGFVNVYCLTPQDTQLELGQSLLVLPHTSQFRRDAAIPNDDKREKVVLIPIGHTEQHGFHLPLSTDTLIIDAITNGVIHIDNTKVCCLPVMPYGVSTHRQAFAGTLNAGGRAFEDFWLAVIDVLVARGFKCFYFMSGHGGNCSFLVNIVKYAGERYRRIFCATAWLYLSGHDGSTVLTKYRDSTIGGMGHAGELETSMILHLRPDLTQMSLVVDETDFISTPNYFMDWNENGSLTANPPWDDDTRTGSYGAGSLGTAEKGKIWLEAAIQEKIIHVREILNQHQLREERRVAGYGLWSGTKPR